MDDTCKAVQCSWRPAGMTTGRVISSMYCKDSGGVSQLQSDRVSEQLVSGRQILRGHYRCADTRNNSSSQSWLLKGVRDLKISVFPSLPRSLNTRQYRVSHTVTHLRSRFLWHDRRSNFPTCKRRSPDTVSSGTCGLLLPISPPTSSSLQLLATWRASSLMAWFRRGLLTCCGRSIGSCKAHK